MAVVITAISNNNNGAAASIITHKKQQEQDDKLIITNQPNFSGLQYGFMGYSEYYQHGILMSEYKIHKTSNDINLIIKALRQEILCYFNESKTGNLLFYQVNNIDPGLISYNIIKSSNYPFVKIEICHRTRNKLCNFYGDSKLYQTLYDELDFLKNYNEYLSQLNKLSKSELSRMYFEVYGAKHKFLLFKKLRIFKALLDNNKRLFIKTY